LDRWCVVGAPLLPRSVASTGSPAQTKKVLPHTPAPWLHSWGAFLYFCQTAYFERPRILHFYPRKKNIGACDKYAVWDRLDFKY
jgi:hypothetical protein